MSSSTKRKPFGEAPRDISNRSSSDANPIKNAMMRSLSGRQPRSGATAAAPPLATIRTESAKITGLPPSNKTTASATDSKTRQYKAQVYSDKITIASQTQRIEALQAELEEVRMFASAEKSTAPSVEESQQNDGELIEALAQELESTEADLKAAQSHVNRLEMELKSERQKNVISSSNKSVGTASTSASTADTNSICELQKIIEKQNAEIEKCKQDAVEGVSIMRDLDKALRAARKDRDVSRAARDEALNSLETHKKQMEGMSLELETSNHHCAMLERQCGEMKEEHSALVARYANLESSLTELQNVLTLVQSRSEKKAASMNQALAEAEEREEKGVIEYQTLMKKYTEVQGQCAEMEGVLTDLTSKFEEVKADVLMKEEELEMAKARHATNVEVIKEQHADEIATQQREAREAGRILYEAMLSKKETEYQAAMNEMQKQYQKQLREKEELLKAREKQWESKSRRSSDQETQVLQARLQQIEKQYEEAKSALMERDEAICRSRSENAKLMNENTELIQKIEKGVAMYNQTASQLKAKTAEAAAAAAVSNNKASDAELVAANKALKKDLTSAVESSISRGKQIQVLEKEIELYQLKLSKANQRLKRIESDTTPSSSNEMQRLESEVVELRTRAEEAEKNRQILQQRVAALDNQIKNAREEKHQLETQLNNLSEQGRVAEETMSNMMQEISALSAKASQVEKLEREVTDARLALADSQSRIFNLEEALQDTEMALRTVSSARLKSPVSSPGKEPELDCRESEIRRQIEDIALKEYIGQRL
ncbi:hypothetical protein ACHAXN_008895 [Cyclotella atomus]